MRRRRTCVLIAAGTVACAVAEPIPPFDETPTISLLITPPPPPLGPGGRADSGLYATLVTTGVPHRSPYLRAERFEMRRLSDGARFGWRPIETPAEAIGAFPDLGVRGNYFLPRGADAAALGSDSIVAGELYELRVETGPHVVIGRTRVPGHIELTPEATDADTIVRWRRAPGAAAYRFGGESIIDFRWIADTAVVVRRLAAFPGEPAARDMVWVFAYDSNLAAFGRDSRVGTAGISGGWGVFGSYTWTETELPPRAGSTPPP